MQPKAAPVLVPALDIPLPMAPMYPTVNKKTLIKISIEDDDYLKNLEATMSLPTILLL